MKIVNQTPDCLQFRSVGIDWVVMSSLGGLLCGFAGWPGVRSGQFFGQLVGAGLLLAGSVAILVSLLAIELWTIYTFDKHLDTVVLRRQYVFYTKTIWRRLEDVAAVVVIEQEDSDRSLFYEINLVLKSGEKLSLREGTNHSDKQEYEQVAAQIRQFLQLS
jgi:hypothetical protein